MIQIKAIEAMDVGEEEMLLSKRIDIFLEAVTDWDTLIDTFEEFELLLSRFLGGSLALGYHQVVSILKEKDTSTEAWRIESASGILRLLEDYNGYTTIGNALNDLKIDILEYLEKNRS